VGVRRDQANLTRAERWAFVVAIKVLKASGRYDHHVAVFRDAMLSMDPDPGHGGPAFFAWHREYLRRFESDLKSIDPAVTLPYWNWTRDNSATSSIWAAGFMGGNGSCSTREVTTGPFAYHTGEWTLTVNDVTNQPRYLRRAFGLAAAALPTRAQVSGALATVPYDVAPWNFSSSVGTSFRSRVEKALHNRVHNWVGGTMLTAASPNDPVFWLHHCNLDRLWARWQKRNPNEAYVPSSGGPQGHNLEDSMWPWSTEASPPTPASVLDHRSLGYCYDDESFW
jgi:tyrosinase